MQAHLPIRSLDRVSENELRLVIALPSGVQTTLSVVFHPLTGKLAKAEVRCISLEKSTQPLSDVPVIVTQLIDSPIQLDDELISGYVQKDDFIQLVHAVWKRLSLQG